MRHTVSPSGTPPPDHRSFTCAVARPSSLFTSRDYLRRVRDLSVVVSAHASCDRVAACLAALAAQTLPAEAFEVVVVLHGPGSSARLWHNARTTNPENTYT